MLNLGLVYTKRLIFLFILTSCANKATYLDAYKFKIGSSKEELEQEFPDYFNQLIQRPALKDKIRNIKLDFSNEDKLLGVRIPYSFEYEESPALRYGEIINGSVYYDRRLFKDLSKKISILDYGKIKEGTEEFFIIKEYEQSIINFLKVYGFNYNQDGMKIDVSFEIKKRDLVKSVHESSVSTSFYKGVSSSAVSSAGISENVGKKIYELKITAKKKINGEDRIVFGAFCSASSKNLQARNVFRKMLLKTIFAISEGRESFSGNFYFYETWIDPIFYKRPLPVY